MTQLGLVYGNLMVNLNPKNSKLVERGVSILRRAAKVSRETAQQALTAAGNSVPVALVMLHAEVNREGAEQALESTRGHVRKAIAAARSL
jgi:N-acetylmuramic acid 6-phosphate etherase